MTEVLQETLEVIADAMEAYIWAKVHHDWQSIAPHLSLKEALSIWEVGSVEIVEGYGSLLYLVPAGQAARVVVLTSDKLRRRLDDIEEGIQFKLEPIMDNPPYRRLSKINVLWAKHLS